MAQSILLNSKSKVTLKELETFVALAREGGLKNDYEFKISKSRGEDILRLSAALPQNVRLVENRVVRVKRKTKKAAAVDQQIEEHKEKKDEGEKVAYVPPVGRTTPPPKKKVKCPSCNTKKPIVKIGRLNCIKPHITKGDPCEGSGIAVRDIPKEEKK